MLLLVGCATTRPPFDLAGIDPALTPGRAVSEASVRGQPAAWGGVIVGSRNLTSSTELEVLAYPLDSSGKPNRDADPLRRFVLVYNGYLEPVDYGPGRLVTAKGRIDDTRTGSVGEMTYTYPVLMADRVHLWPRAARGRTDPNIHFGVGVGVVIH